MNKALRQFAILCFALILFPAFFHKEAGSNQAYAAEFDHTSKNYLSISMGAGLGYVFTGSDEFTHKFGLGQSPAIEYRRFFTPMWGMSVGASFNRISNKNIFDRELDYTLYDDINDQDCKLHLSMTNWTEKQTILAVGIPILAQCMLKVKDNCGIRLGLGIQIGIPVKVKYEVQEGEIRTTGFYQKTNVNIKDLPHHGFYSRDDRPTGTCDTKSVSADMLFQVMMEHKVGKVNLFYGLQTSVNLTNIAIDEKQHLVDLHGNYSGIASSTLINKFSPFDLSLRLGVAIPLKGKQ